MNRPVDEAFGPRTLATCGAILEREPHEEHDDDRPLWRDGAEIPPDKAQWARALEAKLDADELAFFRGAVAKMDAERLARVMSLSTDAAIETLRREMRSGPPSTPTLTTREGSQG